MKCKFNNFLRLLAIVNIFLVALSLTGCFNKQLPPSIEGSLNQTRFILGGETFQLNVSATVPDGSTVSYYWKADDGQLSSDTGDTVSWTAPMTAGSYRVTARAVSSNGKVSTLEKVWTFNVLDSNNVLDVWDFEESTQMNKFRVKDPGVSLEDGSMSIYDPSLAAGVMKGIVTREYDWPATGGIRVSFDIKVDGTYTAAQGNPRFRFGLMWNGTGYDTASNGTVPFYSFVSGVTSPSPLYSTRWNDSVNNYQMLVEKASCFEFGKFYKFSITFTPSAGKMAVSMDMIDKITNASIISLPSTSSSKNTLPAKFHFDIVTCGPTKTIVDNLLIEKI